MSDSLCWICLSKSDKMYCIDNYNMSLRGVYDFLTSSKKSDYYIYTCYICTSLLHKFNTLRKQAVHAQEVMEQYLHTKVVPDSLRGVFHNLSVHHAVDVNINSLQDEQIIKDELQEEMVDVKMEPQATSIVKVEYDQDESEQEVDIDTDINVNKATVTNQVVMSILAQNMLDSLCWICLNKSDKMYCIDNYNMSLRGAYDFLTSSKKSDNFIYTCYICTSLLHKFNTLRKQAVHAQEVMEQYLHTKVVPDSLCGAFHNLSVHHTVDVNINSLQDEQVIIDELQEVFVDVEKDAQELVATSQNGGIKLSAKEYVDGDQLNTNMTQTSDQTEEPPYTFVTTVVKVEYDEDESEHEVEKDTEINLIKGTVANQVTEQSEAEKQIKYSNQKKIYKNKKNYSCTICGKKFTDSTHLNTHIRTHTREKPFSCKVCGKCFYASGDMTKHTRRMHIRDKFYSCDVCEKSFNDCGNMRKHKRIHSKNKPFACKEVVHDEEYLVDQDYINKEINLNEETFAHQETEHSDSEKKILSADPSLNHKKILCKNKKAYSCTVCGKRFNDASYLKKHSVRVHTDDKPYSCRVCEKSFNDANYLKVHNRIHTGEKPYSCNVCGKSFCASSDMKKHIRRMHPGVIMNFLDKNKY
ncbi:unnamed protein product, partial [Leptidea sinapis]